MRTFVCLAIGFVLFFNVRPAPACLRAELDERAVQWSSVIVKAKFVSSKDPVVIKDVLFAVVESTWKVTQVFDGGVKVDAEITVYKFIPTEVAGEPKPDPCGELPTAGKNAILLLRPLKDCTFAQRKDLAEKPADAYVIVQHLSEDEITDDSVKDLQTKIADTRKSEAAFNEKEAAIQAETLANAVDDTEADHADAALLEMGPKAVPAIKAVIEKTPDAKKARLQRIIDELSPPPADTQRKG